MIDCFEDNDAAKRDALRQAALVGIAAIERGDFREFSDVDALRSHLKTVASVDWTD